MMTEVSAMTIFKEVLLFIFQFPFYLRYGGNKHIIFYLAVGGKVLFAVEYIEQDRIQEIVVLLFRVVFDDDVLQLFQFGVYLIMFAGKVAMLYSSDSLPWSNCST